MFEQRSQAHSRSLYKQYIQCSERTAIGFPSENPTYNAFNEWLFSSDLNPTIVIEDPDIGVGALPFFAHWHMYYGTRELVCFPFSVSTFDTLLHLAIKEKAIQQLTARSATDNLENQDILLTRGFQHQATYPGMLNRSENRQEGLMIFQRAVS